MLLQRMLAALAGGGMRSTAELAQQLGVSERLVAAMAGDLVRRGYLMPVDAACPGACYGCSLAERCAAPDPEARRPIVLALTAKGQQAIGDHA